MAELLKILKITFSHLVLKKIDVLIKKSVFVWTYCNGFYHCPVLLAETGLLIVLHNCISQFTEPRITIFIKDGNKITTLFIFLLSMNDREWRVYNLQSVNRMKTRDQVLFRYFLLTDMIIRIWLRIIKYLFHEMYYCKNIQKNKRKQT